LEGVSYLTLNIDNGGNIIPYRIVGSHRHKGFSVYNDVHASWRQYLDEANTETDIVSFTAHNHVKGHLQQSRKAFGGQSIHIHALSLGTYKESDRYSRKKGWPRVDTEKNGGAFGLLFSAKENKVKVFWNLEEMAEEVGVR
jgi:hypothetical protein